MEQLTCGAVNGLVQAQVDRVDLLLLAISWVMMIVGSMGLFGTLYGAKKSFLWFGKKDCG